MICIYTYIYIYIYIYICICSCRAFWLFSCCEIRHMLVHALDCAVSCYTVPGHTTFCAMVSEGSLEVATLSNAPVLLGGCDAVREHGRY